MAKRLVVYDSIFGNTERIARAVAEVLNAPAKRASRIAPADLTTLELLVVGSPTRACNPTSEAKSLFGRLPAGALEGVRAAAFDTRLDTERVKSSAFNLFSRMFGYAAAKLVKLLRRRGAEIITEPTWFFVQDSEGPLVEGELEHARTWAEGLIADSP